MLNNIKINHKLLYFVDLFLVIIIVYFINEGFKKTSENNALSETTVSSLSVTKTTNITTSSQKTELSGIDVSHYQGDVQWQEVANNYQFAFIKATENTDYTDPKFQQNIDSIYDTNILYGAYHFFSPTADAVEQAKHFINTTKHNNLPLPAVLDIEVEPSGSSSEFRTSIKKWLTYVEKNTGCRPIIYTNKHFWDHHLDNSFNDYTLWISDYTTNAKSVETLPWKFWQYSEQGHVQGVSSPVDKNRFRGDLSALDMMKCS